MICRHCHEATVNRPRGLCWSCYYTPGVREEYPPVSKYGRRGVGDFYGDALCPQFPTRSLPGSPEKIAILQQRAQLRQSLWHPLDGLNVEQRQPA